MSLSLALPGASLLYIDADKDAVRRLWDSWS